MTCNMRKITFFTSTALVCALAFGNSCMAQSADGARPQQSPASRAQFRAEMAQLEAAGYDPAIEELDYPLPLQRAQRRVAERVRNGGMQPAS